MMFAKVRAGDSVLKLSVKEKKRVFAAIVIKQELLVFLVLHYL